ncbi:MAG: hypothetical protein J6V89_01390 [Acetobacter sp.]|nr:hypothetical protein [Acetobacter sp.]MBO7072167.1 hypothetical protein [Acetobacter sp.]
MAKTKEERLFQELKSLAEETLKNGKTFEIQNKKCALQYFDLWDFTLLTLSCDS